VPVAPAPVHDVAPAPVAPAPVAPVPAAVPVPVAPAQGARKYDAKETAVLQDLSGVKKEAGAVPTWAFPFFGVLALFSFVAFFAVRASRTRSTRQFRPVQGDVEDGELALMNEFD